MGLWLIELAPYFILYSYNFKFNYLNTLFAFEYLINSPNDLFIFIRLPYKNVYDALDE